MTWIIAGGRNYKFTPEDIEWLDHWLEMEIRENGIPTIMTGGQTGADWHGKQWAKSRGLAHAEEPAEWTVLGKKAGPIRNRKMARQAGGLIAFPGGIGTRDMRNAARELGREIIDLTTTREK